LLDAGKLQWIHRPRIDEIGFLRPLRDAASVIPHEYLLPGSRDGPVSGALALTVAIAEVFVEDARTRRKRALVVMLPGASSFCARAKFGHTL